jgi:RimJ/RimL family protein N-acetyltransferase
VEPIRTRRLDLVPFSEAFMRATITSDRGLAERELGLPLPPNWDSRLTGLFRFRLPQLEADPSVAPWLARAIVLREPERVVVGSAGFHGPPAEGMAELGYEVIEEYRRRGYAQETVEALIGWASREHGVARFRASVSPTNEPSLRLVRKLGFTESGSHWDEIDGEELELDLTLA